MPLTFATINDDADEPYAPPAKAGCCAEPAVPTKHSELRVRWLVLALLCIGLLGSYYCYDSPAATMTQMETAFGGCGGCGSSASDFPTNFNLLYSVYSWPNVILPFFGGALADYLGVRIMMIAFLALLLVGQAIFSLGSMMSVENGAWFVMWAGRTVFGFGGESLSVAQSALIANWFAGKELAFALGLNLALARLGSVINDTVSNAVALAAPVYWAFWLGAIVCGVSLAAGVWTYFLDVHAEDALARNRGFKPKEHPSLLSLILCVPLWARLCGGKRGSVKSSSESDIDAMLLADDEDDGAGGVTAGLMGVGGGSVGEEEAPKETIDLSAVLRFPATFWLLCVSCVCTYACVLSFNNFCAGFVLQKWLTDKPVHELKPDERNSLSTPATNILLITYLTAGFFAPLMGGIIDRVGCRALLNSLSSAAIVGVHITLAYTDLDPKVRAWVDEGGGVCCITPTPLSHHSHPTPLAGTARHPWPVLLHLRLCAVAIHCARDGAEVSRDGVWHCDGGSEPRPRGSATGCGQAHAIERMRNKGGVRCVVRASREPPDCYRSGGLSCVARPQRRRLLQQDEGAQPHRRAGEGVSREPVKSAFVY